MKNIIKSKKRGTFHSAVWEKELTNRKGVEAHIVKRTEATSVRFGVGYENTEYAKEKNGINPETGKANSHGLQDYYEWEDYPFFLKHKTTGKEYLRITLSKNTKFKTKYYENGVEITQEQALAKCLKNDVVSGKHEGGGVINVTCTNMVSVK